MATMAGAAPQTGQNVSRRDKKAARALLGALFGAMPPLMRLIAAVHFRRLGVRLRERFPIRGAALLVANHPSTWTDVLVLEVALGRKLHFLAHETLFLPTARGWILRFFGSLPIAQSRDGPGHEVRNALTFRRCGELLARGEVIAVFPEGTSAGDRSVRPFRTGAARIVLDRLEGGKDLAVVPVSIHYVDRTAFREDVVVSVGEPIRLSPDDAPNAETRVRWIESLTSRLQHAIAWDLRLRPKVLDLDHRADTGGSRAQTAALAVFAALGAPLGIAGILLNAPPAVMTAWYVLTIKDPAAVALARILGGMVTFSTWYAGIALIGGIGHGSWWTGLSVGVIVVVLGAFSLGWIDAMHAWRDRLAGRGLAKPDRPLGRVQDDST